MSNPAPQWLLNNSCRDNHAELYGDRTAFFDLKIKGRYDRYEIKVGDECVVATPSDRGRGANVNFCWFTFSREELREDPRRGKDRTVRVLFGEPIESKSETLTKTDAPTSPYSQLFDRNGGFKRLSIRRGGPG